MYNLFRKQVRLFTSLRVLLEGYTLPKDCPLLLGEACQMRFIGCCGPNSIGIMLYTRSPLARHLYNFSPVKLPLALFNRAHH